MSMSSRSEIPEGELVDLRTTSGKQVETLKEQVGLLEKQVKKHF